MIGKLIGAAAGSQLAKKSKDIGGVGGAAIGALAVPVITRLSIPALLLMGAGAYAFKKLTDGDKAATKKPSPSKVSKANAAASPAA